MKTRILTYFPVNRIKFLLLLSFLASGSLSAQPFEKISQEQGAQGKGKAYGKNKDKWFDEDTSGLGGMSAAAPLPPVVVLALLGGIFGLKAYKDHKKPTD